MPDMPRSEDGQGQSRRQSAKLGPPAIVVGLDCITGLQTARILANRGVRVIGVCDDLRHYCARTRFARQKVESPTSGPPLVQTLNALGRNLADGAVLFPCSDRSVLTISQHRSELAPGLRFVLPEHDVVEMLMDKLGFYRHAEQAGLPVPFTRVLESRRDAELTAEELAFPCVLKPALKSETWERHATAKAYPVADPAELLELYDRCSKWTDSLLVQEWIPGGEDQLFSCNCYFGRDSEPLATFVARKIRQWPPGTGTSCLGEECRNDSVLNDTLSLFRNVAYRGLGYVEMKYDVRTNRHVIIEPNVGRPTGRSSIAEAGGVELVYTMYCDATGLPLPENRRQSYGNVKWIYWRRDLQSAFHYWRRGELTPSAWWRSWRGRKGFAVFCWTDWRPFWGDLAKTARAAVNRLLSKTARQSPLPATTPFESKRAHRSPRPRTTAAGNPRVPEEHKVPVPMSGGNNSS